MTRVIEEYRQFRIVTGRTGTRGAYWARVYRLGDTTGYDTPRMTSRAHNGKGAKAGATQEARDLIDGFHKSRGGPS